jgi:hypothetical protein
MNNEPVAWTACLDCGKRVTGDSIHTCSPQLKTLTDEEIQKLYEETSFFGVIDPVKFARAILRKAKDGHQN